MSHIHYFSDRKKKISLIYLGMNRSFVGSFRKLFHCSLCHIHKNRLPQARRYNCPFCCTVIELHQGKLKMYTNSIIVLYMMSWRPHWCPKTMKPRPCWCPKQVLWELNCFVMQTLSFVLINLYRCWPRE